MTDGNHKLRIICMCLTMFKFYYRSSVRQPVETCQCQMLVISNILVNQPSGETNPQDEQKNPQDEQKKTQTEVTGTEVTGTEVTGTEVTTQHANNVDSSYTGPILLSSCLPKKTVKRKCDVRKYDIMQSSSGEEHRNGRTTDNGR